MSTDRLHPHLEQVSMDDDPHLRNTMAETPIYLPLAPFMEPELSPGGDTSWLEVIRYWVDELRWRRKHWGGGPL